MSWLRGFVFASLVVGCASAPQPEHPFVNATSTLSPPVAPAASPASASPSADTPLSELPRASSLEVTSIDRTIDPCVDLYAFACGGWQKANPIPPDQTKWSVYRKLEGDVERHLWGLLLEAKRPSPTRSKVAQQLGDYFGACTDEKSIDAKGATPLEPMLRSLAAVTDVGGLTTWLAERQLEGAQLLVEIGPEQDASDSTRVIAAVYSRGLGLPDRDDYLDASDKSVDLRKHYLAHIVKLLRLLGDDAATANESATLVLRLETEIAKARLTRVERRDPHKSYHPMKVAGLESLAPSFAWKAYLERIGVPSNTVLDATQPKVFARMSELFASESIASWKRYFRASLVTRKANELSRPFVEEHFDFYRHYLRGAETISPRWKRCVDDTGDDLGEALGQLFVAKNFSADLKSHTQAMVIAIQKEMESDLEGLSWMTPKTKKEALAKLHAMSNKIGYPDRFRDYSSIEVVSDDFFGNGLRARRFEQKRRLAQIGKPVDRTEWAEPPQTVDAYYDAQMNEMNFPAAVFLPPLYDAKTDAAPNFGDTGAMIGHELTHGFDDEGRQFDSKGNLRDWWSKKDAEEFTRRASCVSNQYSSYVATGEVHVNGKLTLGEDIADLGGLLLAYRAWRALHPAEAADEQRVRDGLSPSQRFFVGYAQWDCANVRPEAERLLARTDEHSPPRYRINGVVANMPEYAEAFSCKPGQPMVKAPSEVCRVW